MAPAKVAVKAVPAGKSAVVSRAAAPTAVAALPAAAAAAVSPSPPGTPGPDGPPMTMATFLDRLMLAESGGRLEAKNPRSTALGPFQFIESTFLAVAKRHFSAETDKLTPPQILALRTDLAFSRRAAEAYTMENAAALKGSEIEPTYPNLRLAFLLGAGGAIKVLKADPDTPLSRILSPAVLVANPFMVTMSARSLAARSAREVNQPVTTRQAVEVPPGTVLPRRPAAPAVVVRCNIMLPSCKRWVALQRAKIAATSAAKRAPRANIAAATTTKAAARR